MILLALPLAAAQSLPDLATNTRRLSCIAPKTSSTGAPHPGAESFFSGAFAIDAAGAVTGEERRYMYANATWEAQPGLRQGADCKDVWNLTGRKVRPEKCTDCAFGIQVDAVVDSQRSTCERRVSSDDNRFTANYDVAVKADGSFTVFFARSGKVLGVGKQDGEVFSWISEQTCMWF